LIGLDRVFGGRAMGSTRNERAERERRRELVQLLERAGLELLAADPEQHDSGKARATTTSAASSHAENGVVGGDGERGAAELLRRLELDANEEG
jgi:hypothetical protein